MTQTLPLTWGDREIVSERHLVYTTNPSTRKKKTVVKT